MDIRVHPGSMRRPVSARTCPSVQRRGYRAAKALLGERDAPTGLLCFNDLIAMGAYQALADRQLEVPDDAAVVGFDDHELIAPRLRPRLSTVVLPHYEMGRWAVEHLLEIVEGLTSGVQHRMPCPVRGTRIGVAQGPVTGSVQL